MRGLRSAPGIGCGFLHPRALALVFSVVSCTGCQNKDDPGGFVRRLENARERSEAIGELEKRVADAGPPAELSRSLGARLVQFYSRHDAELTPAERLRIARLVSTLAPAGAAPVVARNLSRFVRSGSSDEELVTTLELSLRLPPGAVDETLLSVFEQLAPDQTPAATLALARRALLRHVSERWRPRLARRIEAPLPGVEEVRTTREVQRRQAEAHRQSVALELSGVQGGEAAIPSVFSVLYDERKRDLHQAAILALLRLGKPAEEHAIAELAVAEHLLAAALVLGQMRDPRARAPLVRALDAADSAVSKAALARELVKLEPDGAALAAYERAYTSAPPALMLSLDTAARDALADAGVYAFDAALVPWLLEQVPKSVERGLSKDAAQNAALLSAIRLMTLEQAPAVRALVVRRNAPLEQEAFAQAFELVRSCDAQLSCYVVAMSAEANQKDKAQLVGIKACVMLGVLGNALARDAIAQRYERIRSPAIRFWAAEAILHLTRGDFAKVSASLEPLVLTRVFSLEPEQRDQALETLHWRLLLRASS